MKRGDDTGKTSKKTDARSVRLAQALRANLRRRKIQERRRGEGAVSDTGQTPQNDKNR